MSLTKLGHFSVLQRNPQTTGTIVKRGKGRENTNRIKYKNLSMWILETSFIVGKNAVL